jgi:hypothetical protein
MRDKLTASFLLVVSVLSGLACSLSELVTLVTAQVIVAAMDEPAQAVIVLTVADIPPQLVSQTDVEEQVAIVKRVMPELITTVHHGYPLGWREGVHG